MANSRKKLKADEAKAAKLEQNALGSFDQIDEKSQALEDNTELFGNAFGAATSRVDNDAVEDMIRKVAKKAAHPSTNRPTNRFSESENEAKSKRIQAMKKDAIRLRKESAAAEIELSKIETKKSIAADKARLAQEDAVFQAELARIEAEKSAKAKEEPLSPAEQEAQKLFEELKRTAPPIPKDSTPLEYLEVAHDAQISNNTRVSNAPQVGADDLKKTAAVHQAVGNFLPKVDTAKGKIMQMKDKSAAELKTLVKEKYRNDPGEMRRDQGSPTKKRAKALTLAISFFDGILKKIDVYVKPFRDLWDSINFSFDSGKKSKVTIHPEEHLKHLQVRKEGLEQKLQKNVKELDDFKKSKNFDAEKGMQLLRQQKALKDNIGKVDNQIQSTELSIKAMKR